MGSEEEKRRRKRRRWRRRKKEIERDREIEKGWRWIEERRRIKEEQTRLSDEVEERE